MAIVTAESEQTASDARGDGGRAWYLKSISTPTISVMEAGQPNPALQHVSARDLVGAEHPDRSDAKQPNPAHQEAAREDDQRRRDRGARR